MLCPLCRQRKAKRTCPALGRQICPTCCGTKRLVEISCPSDCVYLTTARVHPPAVVQRQHDRDRAQLLPMLAGLSERQARLFLMLSSLVARHQGEAFQKAIDDDIGQAAGALAATFETAGRGIVYEHRPASLPAERLLTELKTLMAEIAKEGGSAVERDAVVALRRVEAAAKESAKVQPGGNAFQQLLVRVLLPSGPGEGQRDTPAAPASSLIIP